MWNAHRSPWVWWLFAVANAAACYETKLIDAPEEEPSPGGSGGEAGEAEAGGTASGGAMGGSETGGTSGGSSTGGTATGGTTGGRSTGGTATGGTATGGTASGGSAPLPGVTWLSLDGELAPASLEPNAELAIDGRFYAYADDCATLSWDAETRCASGTLCIAGPNFQNWGVAVGFYFNATGPGDTPPDTKYTWNPTTAGARGVAWRIRGTAPALALWVLNMDPAYQGECAEETCEIVGPPDGTSTPKLEGTLSFSSLHKDDWNGSGIAYDFDPAAVHALQFKLPAIVAGEAEFSFCIDALGVLR